MINTKQLIKSFSHAFNGIYLAAKLDQNMKIHLFIAPLVLIISFLLKVPTNELLFIIFAIFFVLITEMVNTSIEEMTNLITQEHRLSAKIAKDVAAGAVLISAIFAAVIGMIVLFPRIITLF